MRDVLSQRLLILILADWFFKDWNNNFPNFSCYLKILIQNKFKGTFPFALRQRNEFHTTKFLDVSLTFVKLNNFADFSPTFMLILKFLDFVRLS